MTKYDAEFKQQAVQKVLSRNEDQTVQAIADQLNIGRSTLWKWLKLAKFNQLPEQNNMAKEKSPQNWNLSERFNALMETQTLDEQAISTYCREKGLYPHHLKQWKEDFMQTKQSEKKTSKALEASLKKKVKTLEKELRRKEKALAETAALLVLSKKCQAFWNEKKDV